MNLIACREHLRSCGCRRLRGFRRPSIVRSVEQTMGAFEMKATFLQLGAAAMVLTPSLAAAAPTQPSNTPTNTSSPGTQGQPNQSCQTVNGGNTGPYYPGNTSNSPGSAFNESTPGVAGG